MTFATVEVELAGQVEGEEDAACKGCARVARGEAAEAVCDEMAVERVGADGIGDETVDWGVLSPNARLASIDDVRTRSAD